MAVARTRAALLCAGILGLSGCGASEAPVTKPSNTATPSSSSSTSASASVTQPPKPDVPCYLTGLEVTKAIGSIWEPKEISPTDCQYKSTAGSFFTIARFPASDAAELLAGARRLCKADPRDVAAAYGFACRGGAHDKVVGYFLSNVGEPSGHPRVWIIRISPHSESGYAPALEAMVDLLKAIGTIESLR